MTYFFGGGGDVVFTDAGEAPFVTPPLFPPFFDMTHPPQYKFEEAWLALTDSARRQKPGLTFRDYLAAFLAFYGTPREAEIDLWEAALRPEGETIADAFVLWLRSSARKPKPVDILRIVRGDQPVSMRRIALEICVKHQLGFRALTAPDRSRPSAHARQEAMHRMYQAGYSYPQIGRFFRRDHSTVMHGVRAHAARQVA